MKSLEEDAMRAQAMIAKVKEMQEPTDHKRKLQEKKGYRKQQY